MLVRPLSGTKSPMTVHAVTKIMKITEVTEFEV
jgi:hypothetical protein